MKPEKEWTDQKPNGLYVFEDLFSDTTHVKDFFKNVEWFQRFGHIDPNAHYNGHHCMANEHDILRTVVLEALVIAQKGCNHRALEYMKNNMWDVSIATMRHKGAERVFTNSRSKLLKPGWGVGRHPDTWAPDNEGLVLMICIADTIDHHREFKFTCPAMGWKYSVFTPDATVRTTYGNTSP